MALKKSVKKSTTKAVAKSKPAQKPVAAKAATKAKTAATKPATKVIAKKNPKTAKPAQLSGEELMVENLATLSSLVRTISETLDVLVQKVENMAYHLIATEETLAEVVATTGVDLAQVNKRIRTKIANGTDRAGDPSRAIDVAASIASPLPRSRK
jgi:hypothetical protein